MSERDHPEATCAQRLLGGEMAPASPLGVGGGVGLSRREAVHRFTRVLRAATGDPGRPPCGAREHAADDQDRGSPTDRLESPHHDRCREPAEREPHRLYRQRSGSPFLEPRDGRRRDGEEADQAHADCQQQHREEELGTTIDHGDRDEAGSAHDRAGTHHRAHTPSLDLSPLHRPDEGGLRARGPEDDREEGLRPAELISEFHGEIPEPLDPHHRLERPHDGIGTDDLPSGVPTPSRGVGGGLRHQGIVPSWSSKHKTVVFVPRGFLPAVQRPPLKVRGQLRDQLVGKPRSTDELAGSGQRVVSAWGLV